MDVKVPPGFRFEPTHEELISDYLNHWITGRPIEELHGIVVKADVYGTDPATLTQAHEEYAHVGKTTKAWYFLSVAKRKGNKRGNAGRNNRCIDGDLGNWHNSQRRKAVHGFGERQAFEYRTGEHNKDKTEWLMEELMSNLPAAITDEGTMVICKVYKSPRKNKGDENVVGKKRLRLGQQHESAADETSDQAATASTEFYCPTTTYTSGHASNAVNYNDYSADFATIKPEDYDNNNYDNFAINTQAADYDAGCYNDFLINTDMAEPAYDAGYYGDFPMNTGATEPGYDAGYYGEAGIGVGAEMVPLAMQSSNGEMTYFVANQMYGQGNGVTSIEEARQESEMPLAIQDSNGENTNFAPMYGHDHGVGGSNEMRRESRVEDDPSMDAFLDSLFADVGKDDPNPNPDGHP
uniref:NAC domain-containing protein n=1 Tax=Leersia perrieri TaxID=77586 RepID=A0A0D9XWR1_9ORYZ